jgi:hypothetical protein
MAIAIEQFIDAKPKEEAYTNLFSGESAAACEEILESVVAVQGGCIGRFLGRVWHRAWHQFSSP